MTVLAASEIAGDEVEIEFLRDGARQEVSTILGSLEESEIRASAEPEPGPGEEAGRAVRYLAESDAEDWREALDTIGGFSEWNLVEGRCRSCDTVCAGVFDDQPGTWGPRRLPVRLAGYAQADTPGE